MFQLFGYAGNIAVRSRGRVVEDERNFRAVPGSGSFVNRQLEGEHVGIGCRLRAGSFQFDKVLASLAEDAVQTYEITEALSGIGFFKQRDQLVGVLVAKFVGNQLAAFFFGHRVAVGIAGAKGDKFVQYGANHDRDGLCMFGKTDGERVAGIEVVGNRTAGADIMASFGNFRTYFIVGFGKIFVGNGFQFFHIFQAQLFHQCLDDLGAIGNGGILEVCDTRLDDAFVEQAFGGRGLHQRIDFHAAARLAEQSDILRVSAEVCDIVMNPLKGSNHVRVACVAGVFILVAERGEVHVAQDIQTMVQGNDDHITKSAQRVAVICLLFNRRTGKESAAMQPDHDRLFGGGVNRLGPDVEVLAVFIHWPVAMGDLQFTCAGFILLEHRADIAIAERILNPFPALGRGGKLKAFCIGVFDAVKGVGAVQNEAAQFSIAGLNDRFSGGTDKFFCHSHNLLWV